MSTPLAAVTAPLSVVESIYTQVRNEVLAGRIHPGTALRQEEVASRLGVSKIPVREAFSRLESEGLLVLRPRRGYEVTSFDIKEIMEIFALRAIVEQHAGQLAAANRTPEDIAYVSRLADAMEALDTADPGYHDAWCDLNREFHDAIIASSKARHVIRTAVQLRNIVEPYVRLETSIADQGSVADREHRQIVHALEAGDASLVGTLSVMHCYSTRDRLVEALRRSEPRGPEGSARKRA